MIDISGVVTAISRGWYVFPCVPNGKRPLGSLVPNGQDDATNDLETALAWWEQEPNANIGIACEKSNLYVIDLDRHNESQDGLGDWMHLCGEYAGGEVPSTYVVETYSGGQHIYFEKPSEGKWTNTAKKLSPAIDTRCNGYVVAAGSVIDGSEYKVKIDAPIVELPDWVKILLAKPKPKPKVKKDSILDETPKVAANVRKRVEQLAEELKNAPEGAGNETASRIAFYVGQYVGAEQFSEDEALKILSEAVEGWTFDTNRKASDLDNTIRKQLAKGIENPRAWTSTKVDLPPEFVDAAMSKYVASQVLDGKYLFTKGFGWLEWTGKIWVELDDDGPINVVRAFVNTKLMQAIKDKGIGSPEAKGWIKYNSAGAIRNIIFLARQLPTIKQDAANFDAHEDLINTPDGVLDLRTFEVKEHEGSYLFTKITKASYRPELVSDVVDAVLESVPEDSREWLQVFMGQGVSGRQKGRTPAVLLTGTGQNGKTLLMEAAVEALGGVEGTGYATQVPNEILLSTGKKSGGANPEKMLLRGARLVYVEETPEGRYLDVEKLKQIVGTGNMTTRHLYKDLVTFKMTHIMFINTNYPPRVSETDTSTWSRLTALKFPYRFRSKTDDLGKWEETDKPAKIDLQRSLRDQKNLDVLFTWMAEGLRKGEPQTTDTPESVRTSVNTWRKEADTLLRFIEDVFVYDENSWIPSTVFYSTMKKWHEMNGHGRPVPANQVTDRLATHTGLGGNVYTARVMANRPGYMKPETSFWLSDEKTFEMPSGKQVQGIIGLRFKRANIDD